MIGFSSFHFGVLLRLWNRMKCRFFPVAHKTCSGVFCLLFRFHYFVLVRFSCYCEVYAKFMSISDAKAFIWPKILQRLHLEICGNLSCEFFSSLDPLFMANPPLKISFTGFCHKRLKFIAIPWMWISSMGYGDSWKWDEGVKKIGKLLTNKKNVN